MFLGMALVAVVALIAGCSGGPSGSDAPRNDVLQKLADQQAVWAAKKLDDYSFTITRACFCPFTEPVVVTVVDGAVTSASRDGKPVPAPELQGLPTTIPALFAAVRSNANAARVTVDWDPTFGYPFNIAIDAIENAVDDEFGYQVTDFRPAS